jgi:hypothetical protein
VKLAEEEAREKEAKRLAAERYKREQETLAREAEEAKRRAKEAMERCGLQKVQGRRALAALQARAEDSGQRERAAHLESQGGHGEEVHKQDAMQSGRTALQAQAAEDATAGCNSPLLHGSCLGSWHGAIAWCRLPPAADGYCMLMLHVVIGPRHVAGDSACHCRSLLRVLYSRYCIGGLASPAALPAHSAATTGQPGPPFGLGSAVH